MKTYHLVQLRYPGELLFSSPLAVEVEGELPCGEAMEIAFKKNPSAAEGRYIAEITKDEYFFREIKEITQDEYLTITADYDRPS